MTRRMLGPWGRFLLLLWLFGLGACTLLGVGQKSSKSHRDKVRDREAMAAQDPDARGGAADDYDDEDEDDEEGVRAISKNIRRFNKALRNKDFKKATEFVTRAERGVRKASEVTKAHPDFEDIQMTVQRSRNRLNVAIEEDRIARRNAAIDELMRKGHKMIRQARAFEAELSLRVITPEDVERVDEAVKAMDTLQTQGAEFLDEERYNVHAKERNAAADELRALRKQARWQVDAAEKVGATVVEGYGSVSAAQKAKGLEAQLSELVKARVSFQGCVSRIADLERSPEFRPKREIKTRLGALTLPATKAKCLELVSKLREKIDAMSWEKGILAVVDTIGAALKRVNVAEDLEAEIEASEAAVKILGKCAKDLERTERAAGYEKNRVFDTGLGKVTAVALRTDCRNEAARLDKGLPVLRWRATLGGLISRVARVKELRTKAESEKDPEERVRLWDKALGSMRECISQAKSFARQKGASKSARLETAYGALTIGEIEKRCSKNLGESTKLHAKAISLREAETFAATCKGDEVDVVRREGIPTRIESYAAGRVFFYEGRGRSGNRFGFDKKGTRVDFWAKWRKQMEDVVGELERVYKPFRTATGYGDTLRAGEAAQPVLQVCQELLTAGQKSPGYDAKATFKTAIGKANAAGLIVACGKEAKRLKAQQASLKWKADVEALYETTQAAEKAIADASAIKSAEERVKVMGRTIGAMEECGDRVGVLAKSKSAERRFKLKTAAGKFSLDAIRKICGALVGKAKVVVHSALAEKRRDKFLEKCRGDEVAVVKREGLPSMIQDFAEGRVLIFEQGRRKKAKRVAFDKKGKRTTEAVLGKAKGKPKAVEP